MPKSQRPAADAVVSQRIAGRKQAEEVIAVYAGEAAHAEGFARACRVFADSVLGVVEVERVIEPSVRAMDPKESKAFESVLCMYAKHKDEPWGDVPISYIERLVDLVVPLRRYLMSDRAQKRAELEERMTKLSTGRHHDVRD